MRRGISADNRRDANRDPHGTNTRPWHEREDDSSVLLKIGQLPNPVMDASTRRRSGTHGYANIFDCSSVPGFPSDGKASLATPGYRISHTSDSSTHVDNRTRAGPRGGVFWLRTAKLVATIAATPCYNTLLCRLFQKTPACSMLVSVPVLPLSCLLMRLKHAGLIINTRCQVDNSIHGDASSASLRNRSSTGYPLAK